MIGARTNKRLESIKVLVHEMLLSIECMVNRQEATVHLYGVSIFASMLAMKRGQNPELATITGLLRDYYVFKTGINEFPGPNSAEAVRTIIRDTGMFTEEEQITVLRSIFYQNDSSRNHDPYEEILKDANVLQLYFQNTGHRLPELDINRLRNVLNELEIVGEFKEEEFNQEKEMNTQFIEDKRRKLADIAEVLAGQNIIGIPGDERYREICRYWPDASIYKVLKNSWCAAFVYHSCRQAGFLLPIRYPNGIHRFAGVGAWLEWAQLPETGFFHLDEQDGFTPQRGDIVIYDKLLSDHSHDHIGIVLAGNEEDILVAEGNRDNKNYSSIFHRDRRHRILGYIRIDNSYRYHFRGEYKPF
ncbi:CHAP domain-containing protein [Paenibacillus sp. 1_12]|uniref:CHAP domain-containing protein n=1 Tax=Paenibacillus sp. 1_12 TaxID=1566278 RepID=UPI0008E275B3|nr:CHAP domain-containing protein [Paenibacillus sp. 1_12]SFM30275.1 CHAP domain-containing protein [Paenibacillus sp. 1_12]